MSRLFEELEPPGGGLQRLRARIDHERGARARRRMWWLAPAALAMGVAAAALVVVFNPATSDTLMLTASANPALARYGYALTDKDEAGALAMSHDAQQGDVLFYWVAPLRSADPTNGPQ